MNKTLRALFVVAGIAVSSLTQAADLPPATGLTMCAGVYGTLQAYANTPDARANLQNRAMQIMKVALKYNPNASNDAIALMKDNQARVNRNDPTVANEVGNAEKFCRGYVQQYGL